MNQYKMFKLNFNMFLYSLIIQKLNNVTQWRCQDSSLGWGRIYKLIEK